MVTDDRARCDTREINQSFVLPFGCIQLQNGNRQACPYTASKSADLSRKLSWNRNSRYHWRCSSGDINIWPWCVRISGLWMKIKLFCGSLACLSVCWRFIIRWDLESHGIYKMLQLTTLLYFEAFDGDSPKNRLWVRITLMSALSDSLNAFGSLVICGIVLLHVMMQGYFHIIILSIGYDS